MENASGQQQIIAEMEQHWGATWQVWVVNRVVGGPIWAARRWDGTGEIAGQQTAAAILERLRYQSVRYQFHVSLLPGRIQQGLKEHLAIIEAVTSGDPDVAERTMREHLSSVIGALQQLAAMGAAPIPLAATWR